MPAPAVALAGDIDSYLHSLRGRSPHTLAAYRRDLKHFEHYLAAQGIAAWSAVDVHCVRAWVSARHRDGAHGHSLARALSSLRSLFKYLAARGVVGANPAHSVRAPKSPRRLPRALDVDQMASLLEQPAASVLAQRDQAMWETLYSCGLRVSELVGLDLADLDLREREARVLGKGRKQRLVPLGKIAIAALTRWLELRAQLAHADERAVFVNQRGGRLTTRGVQQRLRAWVQAHALELRVHPHMLRHSFASHLLESSGDLRAVQEVLGHANIGTTQMYTQLDFLHLAKVYDAAHPRARRRSG